MRDDDGPGPLTHASASGATIAGDFWSRTLDALAAASCLSVQLAYRSAEHLALVPAVETEVIGGQRDEFAQPQLPRFP
jgi:hypothetical protein